MDLIEKIKSEGDFFEWIHITSNEVEFRCKAVRHKSMGHLCGYVILNKDNKYFGKHYDEIPVEVHGGLTYSEEEDGDWVVGFDCAHYGDKCPYNEYTSGIYRDKNFVKFECESLAEQLSSGSISRIRQIKLDKLL